MIRDGKAIGEGDPVLDGEMAPRGISLSLTVGAASNRSARALPARGQSLCLTAGNWLESDYLRWNHGVPTVPRATGQQEWRG